MKSMSILLLAFLPTILLASAGDLPDGYVEELSCSDEGGNPAIGGYYVVFVKYDVVVDPDCIEECGNSEWCEEECTEYIEVDRIYDRFEPCRLKKYCPCSNQTLLLH